MRSLFVRLSDISLVWYNIFAFVFGAIAGVIVKTSFGNDKEIFDSIISIISPYRLKSSGNLE